MKAALYCRLSEEDKNKTSKNEDSESIQNQKNLLVHYANEQGFEIYRIYTDDDYSGSDRSRPAFNLLIEDARLKKFDVVLCKTQSRFTRELELVEKYIHHLFPLWGIRFIGIVDHADTENPGNKKARQINGLINEWYLEDMSENIRSVLNHKRQQGLHIGSFALYGYLKDPLQKGHLLIDPEAAHTVRTVFDWFSQGYGKTAIARMLNEQNIPNPTEYKRLRGLRYQQPKNPDSTLWKYPAIASMLNNPIYIGHMVQGKYGSISYKTKENRPRPKKDWFIVENTHEPIIDLALWNNVQNLLAQKNRPYQMGTIGLFTGKIRCMHCGHLLRSSKNKGKYYLQCPTRYISKNNCQGTFIAVDTLKKIILHEIEQFSNQYLNIDQFLSLSQTKASFSAKSTAYQQKMDVCQKALQDLYLDKVQGRITQEMFFELSQKFTEQKNTYHHLLSQEASASPDIHSLSDLHHFITQNFDHYAVNLLIDHIKLGKKDLHTKTYPIEIHWNF